MADLLRLAREKRDKLASEIRRLDEFIATAEQLAEESGRDHAIEQISDDLRRRRRVYVSSDSRRPTTTQATYDAVRGVLERVGRPVHVGYLLKKLQENGVVVGGKEPSSTLSARLSNSDEFISIRGLGWWFAEKPLPSELEKLKDKETAESQRSTAAASNSETSKGGTLWSPHD